MIPGAAYAIGTRGFDDYANLLLATLQRAAQRPAPTPLRSSTRVLDSIEFQRLELAGGCRNIDSKGIDQQGWRPRLLRELLADSSVPKASDFDARIQVEHVEQVRHELETHVAAVRARLESLVDSLACHKLVELAAKERLRLNVDLRDSRPSGSPPLPQPHRRADVTFELR